MAELEELNSYIWSDKGVEPTPGDEVYRGGVQPIAEYDNHFNRTISKDLHTLKAEFADHDERHEADGRDEINLRNLKIGRNGILVAPTDHVGIKTGTDPNAGKFAALLDVPEFCWEEFAPFCTPIIGEEGIRLTGGVTNIGPTNVIANTTNPDTDADTLVVYDSGNEEVPQPQLGGPAKYLTSYPLPNRDLLNPYIDIVTGRMLGGGGRVRLGEWIELDFTGEIPQNYIPFLDHAHNWENASEGGLVRDGNGAFVGNVKLSPGWTADVWEASMYGEENNEQLEPVPSGVDLIVATPDRRRSTIFRGDDRTVFNNENDGPDPLASYTNTSTESQHVLIAVDNGHFNNGSDANREVQADVIVHKRSGDVAYPYGDD